MRRAGAYPVARRAALLLEVLLALAIFVMMAILILSAVQTAAMGVVRSRDAARAADLARSTMARLEAGLGTARALNGPVRSWAEAGQREDEFAVGLGDEPQPHEAPWEVRIETSPSQFEGLTHVTVQAFRRASRNSDQFAATYTLHQLVRLSAGAEDEVGEEDALLEEARRGLREMDRGLRP